MPASTKDRFDAGHPSDALPFDNKKLDELLGQAGVDVVLVTSKHNIQYLLDGYRYFFFDQFDAIGISRYLPILIYPRGRPAEAVYIGNAQEDSEAENGRFWCPAVETQCWGTLDSTARAVEHLRRLAGPGATLGVEFAFLPTDAGDALRSALAGYRFIDAHLPLERLRAVKRPAELLSIQRASDGVVDAMLATFAQIRPGQTKREIAERMRREEVARGLSFHYCLLTAGADFNRSPNDQVIRPGDVISLDSGGSYMGYIGDLCRMGVVGPPDAELDDLLGGIEDVQQAARRSIAHGVPGAAIFEAVEPLLRALPDQAWTDFVAHGMGIIAHEAPRLSDRGPVTYPAYDADLPLQEGMVLSIETTLKHPRRGYIKLEDTLVVTATGWEAYGDGGRGWNVPTA